MTPSDADLKLWISNSPAGFQSWVKTVSVRHYLREQRNKLFQMQGAYDGAMSEECKSQFADEYRAVKALLEFGGTTFHES